MWLETPVEETDGRGNRNRAPRNKDEGRQPTRRADLAVIVEHVHATFCAGMEAVRSREESPRLGSSIMRMTS